MFNPPTGPLVPPGAPRQPVSNVVARAKIEQDIIVQIERLPALPAVVVEVLRLSNDANSTAKDLQGVLRQDQVLVGRILKLVNSSFYSRTRRISSVQESVVVLGYDTIKNVVLAASATKFMNRPMEAYGYAELGLWKHSLACAVFSKRLATHVQIDREIVPEFFLAGLLHDIGKLVLDGFLRDSLEALREMRAGKPLSDLEAERRLIGFDHTEVGVRVAKRWNFPAQVEEVVRAHHGPAQAVRYPRHTAVVHVANAYMNAAGIGLQAGPSPLQPPAVPVLEMLGLGEPDLVRLQEIADQEVEHIRALCDSLKT